MTKLNKKLSLSICLVVVLVSIASLGINKLFVQKYYLYEKKKIINNLGNEIENLSFESIIKEIDNIEQNNNVTIVYAPLNLNSLNVERNVNETLIYEFFKKGISLKKFWITKEDLNKIENNSVNKIYNQEKSKYSLLVKFMKKDDYVIAITSTIEHSKETINIINKFYIIMSGISILVITLLTIFLSNRIIKPIKELNRLAQDISMLNFRTIEINTNDEIEELAESINKMSISLDKAHRELNSKNENLKRFISDASHEMKTPVALIKAYAMGIQDGIDDDTFLETIIEESEKLTNIINTLLYWAKYEKKEINISRFDLKEILLDTVNKYEILIKENNINVETNIEYYDFIIEADENSIKILLDNLISNAIKYTNDNNIELVLSKNKEDIYLGIKNGVKDISKEEIDNIWNPFYVLEKSRSKELSGTGLGLSIAKEILEAHKFKHGVKVQDNKIEFYFIIKHTCNILETKL